MSIRQALVIGATEYRGPSLDNAVDDACHVAEALSRRGFAVSIVLNPDRGAIDAALAAFQEAAQTSELALVYLAGHAVERDGRGYFLSTDVCFPLTAAGLRYTATSLNAFVDATSGATGRMVVLDGCRNWPQDSSEGIRASNDLEELAAGERNWPNLLLAYATSAATTAGDGIKGSGSAFTNSFCRHLVDHSITVDECFRRVSQDVVADGRGQQPWTYSSLARTLSFTDLPRFAAVQRHAVPNQHRLSVGTWSIAARKPGGIVMGLGDRLAWAVGLGGFKQVAHTKQDDLVGAAECGNLLFLAGSEGALYVEGAGSRPAAKLKVPKSFGLQSSPARDGFIHYGGGHVCLLKMQGSRLQIVARYEVDFEVYCCSYMPDGLIWIAGERGMICQIDPENAAAPISLITTVKQHVNAIAVSPSGDRVFVVGQRGLALELDRSGLEIIELLPGRAFSTAAGIRAQLVNFADDEHIRRFLFEPSDLSVDLHEWLAERVGRPSYMACAVAPSLPILAIGTQESSVVLLDTRDLQVIQELDVASGNSAIVAGVHFLSDHDLAVVGGRGDLTFFGACQN